jgi:hypothetical protein
MAGWLGVVSAEHVAHGVSLGIAQINHGQRSGLARMRPGDWLIYYSPRRSLSDNQPVKAFTAIGQLPDTEIWQADEGSFKPWRRRVSYVRQARPVPIETLRDRLDLTATATWGHQLRRGLIPLSDGDVALICRAMTQQLAEDLTADGGAATVPPGTQPSQQRTETLW